MHFGILIFGSLFWSFFIGCSGGNGGGTTSEEPLFSDQVKIFETSCKTNKNGTSSWIRQKTFGKDWLETTIFYFNDPQCTALKVDEIISRKYSGATQVEEAELSGWQTYGFIVGAATAAPYSIFNVRDFNWNHYYQSSGWELNETKTINGLKRFSDSESEPISGTLVHSTMRVVEGHLNQVYYSDGQPIPDEENIYSRVSNEVARKIPVVAGSPHKPIPLDPNIFNGVFIGDCLFNDQLNTSYFRKWTFGDQNLLREEFQFTGPECKNEMGELIFRKLEQNLEREIISELDGWTTFVVSTGSITLTLLTSDIVKDFNANGYYGITSWQVDTPYEINGRKWNDSSNSALPKLMKPFYWSVMPEGDRLKVMIYENGKPIPEKAMILHRKAK